MAPVHNKQLAYLMTAGGPKDLDAVLDNLVRVMGEESFVRQAAGRLVEAVHLEELLGGSLDRFTPLVKDGITYFLTNLSMKRIRAAIHSQASLAETATSGQRLLALALHFPTLHKLGQVIARHPELNPRLKRWLIQLEEGRYAANAAAEAGIAARQQQRFADAPHVSVGRQILAEASVAAVLPFCWQENGRDMWREGVFKVLKPGIGQKLAEELESVARTAAFLQANRGRYGLEDLKLTEMFQEVRSGLAREIDLRAEQEHLAEAGRLYRSVDAVVIPQLAPFCSETVTAMSRVAGGKITEAEGDAEEKGRLARLVLETVLCRPLFSPEERALFHGDPHAGNIRAVPAAFGPPRIGLLDWTLADYLSKGQRLRLMELMTAVFTNDASLAATAVGNMIGHEPGEVWSEARSLKDIIKALMEREEIQSCGPLQKTFWLMEQLALKGAVFPSELILYRKSFFTLAGVLHDISPDFDLERAMEQYLGRLVFQELPARLGACFLGPVDSPHWYRSLLSNRDLQTISLYQAISAWQRAMLGGTALFAAQVQLSGDYFNYLSKVLNAPFGPDRG